MTPEERADTLGDVIERQELPLRDVRVEVWRGDVADAIRDAVAQEREACAALAETRYGLKLVPAVDAESAKTEAGHKIAAAIRARKENP